MRLIAEFCKTGRCIWFSHLDLQRTMQRALRRAQIPIAYSQGFNPHAELSFASALAVGAASNCEIMDIKLSAEIQPGEFVASMNRVLPEELHFSRARLVEDRFPAPMAKMERAGYEVLVANMDLSDAVQRFLQSESVLVEKQSKGKSREVDIRPMVHELKVEKKGEDSLLHMLVTCTNADNLKPDLLLSALCPGAGFAIMRVQMLSAGGRPLFEFVEDGKA